MKIAPRMISIFLPVFLVPIILITYLATSSAGRTIAGIARNALEFKASELRRFAEGEVSLLKANKLEDSPEFVKASQQTIANYAAGLVRSPTELIAAFDEGGILQFSTSDLEIDEKERKNLLDLFGKKNSGWRELNLGGVPRVADLSYFEPYGWAFLITEQRDTFFSAVDRITLQSIVTAGISMIVVIILVIVFSRFLTKPLEGISRIMQRVVDSGDLSQRTEILYDDELGILSESFNAMTSSLEQAYGEIKNFALQAAVARKREMKIRNIFQKFVPRHVIEEYFNSPESLLVGAERELAILFSDIRNFTSLSEEMNSRDLVESLNNYFDHMVDKIMAQQGVVDKYIGDAIMAFFGAPAADEKSAFHAVVSALDMMDALNGFNDWQKKHRRKAIRIGIGINYGPVTIGNIGTERKMEYTVIGDMVNTASRIEGLTKYYHESILISESVRERLPAEVHSRLVDRVIVKGKTSGIGIFTVRRNLDENERIAWPIHAEAARVFYARDFEKAGELFKEVGNIISGDFVSEKYLRHCEEYIVSPPPNDWAGTTAHQHK